MLKHKLVNTFGISLALIIGSSALFSDIASAAYYGVGTSINPYRITDCTDLQNINNNLSADYILVANINCDGVSFNDIAYSSDFTGTLNGQDHTISNLNVSEYGLFGNTDNATIENLTIGSGSINDSTSDDYFGGVIGYANNTTISNVHSAQSLIRSAQYGYAGGLVGYLTGTSTISQSSFSGTLNDTNAYDEYVGGLVGLMNATSITDSYVGGTITTSASGSDFKVGGITGMEETGTISNTYSSAAINVNSGSTYLAAGGLEGELEGGSINNSFSSSTLSGSLGAFSYEGAVFGEENSSLTNIYFDAYLASDVNCSGSGVECNTENIGNATPNYFKDNDSNGPFNNWNFNTIWSITSGYPTLDDIQLFNATSGIPNAGDANGDGTADSYQAFVGSVEGSNNIWATIELPSSNECSLGNLAASSPTSYSGYSADTSLISYDAYCSSVGLSVPVTIIFNTQINTSKAILLYYNPNTGTTSVVSNAVFGTITVGGVTETTVTYTVTDGGAYDDNSTADGLIIDPIEIAVPATATSSASTSSPDTGYGTPNSTNSRTSITELVVSIALIVLGYFLVMKRSNRESASD